jgi:hypothetical protein
MHKFRSVEILKHRILVLRKPVSGLTIGREVVLLSIAIDYSRLT